MFDEILDTLTSEYIMFGAHFSCVPPHIVQKVSNDMVYSVTMKYKLHLNL